MNKKLRPHAVQDSLRWSALGDASYSATCASPLIYAQLQLGDLDADGTWYCVRTRTLIKSVPRGRRSCLAGDAEIVLIKHAVGRMGRRASGGTVTRRLREQLESFGRRYSFSRIISRYA